VKLGFLGRWVFQFAPDRLSHAGTDSDEQSVAAETPARTLEAGTITPYLASAGVPKGNMGTSLKIPATALLSTGGSFTAAAFR
jgi:hypothetical protein